jgi:UDP-N-acetyl-D-galactosamine dehydrogenase
MSKKIGVIGLGYVGLPLAVEFAKKYNVVGYDISEERIKELNNGYDRTNEISSEELAECNILFTQHTISLRDCDTYIITVPTPIDNNKQPDLSPLISASETVGSMVKADDLVIYESTVYPTCTEEVCIPILDEKSGLKAEYHYFVGYSPERINPGDKVNTLTTIKKVVSGNNYLGTKKVNELYKSIGIETHVAPNIQVAEMSKAIENAQRDLNISFMNELAIYCNHLGIRTNDVLKAAGTKWNFLPFTAGLVGGHCISVDPYYLIHKAEGLGLHLNVIASGRRVNDQMPKFVVSNLMKKMIQKRCDVINPRILVMGITFKENVPDLRNSKVIEVVEELKSYNTTVDVFDPYADNILLWKEYQITSHKKIRDLGNVRYDAIIYAVDHDKFKQFKYWNYLNPIASVIYDLKNKLPEDVVDIYL